MPYRPLKALYCIIYEKYRKPDPDRPALVSNVVLIIPTERSPGSRICASLWYLNIFSRVQAGGDSALHLQHVRRCFYSWSQSCKGFQLWANTQQTASKVSRYCFLKLSILPSSSNSLGRLFFNMCPSCLCHFHRFLTLCPIFPKSIGLKGGKQSSRS